VLAHVADEPVLKEIFLRDEDVHTATASQVFGKDPADLTPMDRSKSKMINYGIVYGLSDFGLADRLNIPREEAKAFIDAYLERFAAVATFIASTIEQAAEQGYVSTLFGRRRQIPELSSPNYRIRQAGERQAMNAGIQGLAADIFKVALVRLEAALEAAGMDSRLILQVHDEVLLDVPPAEHDAATDVVVEAMRGAAELNVPLEVNLAFGPSWADAKG
jgi:DNA polymerase-1